MDFFLNLISLSLIPEYFILLRWSKGKTYDIVVTKYAINSVKFTDKFKRSQRAVLVGNPFASRHS